MCKGCGPISLKVLSEKQTSETEIVPDLRTDVVQPFIGSVTCCNVSGLRLEIHFSIDLAEAEQII